MEIKGPFSEADWLVTPKFFRLYIENLEQMVIGMMVKVERLERGFRR
jgi:hypothetical protein